ncbi:Sucrase/ferredoxin-like-domain-containing protein [Chlamydoabsidia padenii]|nr:Sucrase/ferredoxin-like-domain-containing protein [Chlamydoabsidia padenii]
MASFLTLLSSVVASSTTSLSSPTTPTPTKELTPSLPLPKVEIDQLPPNTELVDCNNCAQECYEHPAFPSYLNLDNTSDLLGSMTPYGRHVMISTGVTDWPERIEDDKTTLAGQLSHVINQDTNYTNDKPNGRIFITNTSMSTIYSSQGGQDVLLLPENILISNVKPSDAELFYTTFLDQPLPHQPTQLVMVNHRINTLIHNNNILSWQVHANPSASMILICSHRRRDKRCGVTAPILAREFDHVLRENDIDEYGEKGTAVLMVSHVGGHKFAGNLICYTHQGTRGVWYGRVKPCHCKQIVQDTILQGRIVKELYRGAMMHSYGSPSSCTAKRIQW